MSKQTKDRPRLGRGLAALIAVTDSPAADLRKHGGQGHSAPQSPLNDAERDLSGANSARQQPILPPEHTKLAGGFAFELPLDAVVANPKQPRQSFNEVALKELAESMKVNGVIQPVIVRPAGEGTYQLVAGERRWRAARMAGLTVIPAIVRDIDALTQAQIALIENIQREDLNPIDRANGYQTLLTELGLTQAELSGRLGEDRSSIANFLRLLELTEAAKEMVRTGKLSLGHAKLLAGVADILEQQKLADLVVSQGLSVRNLERVIQERLSGSAPKPVHVPLSPHLADVEKTLCRELGVRVQLRASKERGRGRLILHYSNLDQFDEIIDRLGVNLAAD